MFAWSGTTISGDVLYNDIIHGWSFSSTLSPVKSTYCCTDEDMLQKQKLFCQWPCSMEEFASYTAL